MSLDLATRILGAFPAPILGGTRGKNCKDLTVRQLALLLAVEALGSVTTERLLEALPGSGRHLERQLDQLLARLLLSHRDGRWSVTIKGLALLDSAPDRINPPAPQPLKLPDCKVIDLRQELLDSIVAVPAADGTLRVHVPPKQTPVTQPKPTGSVLLVQDAEQAVARAELLHKDERSPRTFELLSAAYDDLDAARQAAREEAKPGPKAKPKKPKHKED